MKPLSSLVRRNILALAPYSTARDDYKGGDISVWLDANESPYDNGFNRYPDPHQKLLKEAVGNLKGIDPDRIFIGNGSDEAIDLAFRIFCIPSIDNVVAIAPSYGMYEVAAEINDVEVRKVLLGPEFSLPVADLLKRADDNTKLLWICSPNNPSGNAFDLDDIALLLSRFEGIVVVDEAYADFSAKGSAIALLDRFPNLIVLQTMSKARAMAALRLGLAFASRDIMALFAKVKYPYNVSSVVQQTVLRLIQSDISPQIDEIITQRSILADALSRCSCVRKVFHSDANFILAEVSDANAIYDRLVEAGVIVRNRTSMPLCHNCLRITVGTPAENARVIDLLSNFLPI